MPLSAVERLQLIQTLNRLPQSQFAELVVALNPPAGILPPNIAAQGDRTPALLQWVESSTGRGLAELQSILNLILTGADSASPTATPPTANPAIPNSGSRSQGLKIQRLETTLADLEQDYQSVEKQLRVEQDGPTRNKLERQLELISQEMDECEQQLARLRQGNG